MEWKITSAPREGAIGASLKQKLSNFGVTTVREFSLSTSEKRIGFDEPGNFAMLTLFLIHLACVAIFFVFALRAPVREDFHDAKCDWPVPNPLAVDRSNVAPGAGFFGGTSRSYPSH